MRLWCALMLTLVMGVARPVQADDTVTTPPRKPVSSARRALAITAAIIPGIVIRGAGSWVIGEKRAAKRLATGAFGGLLLAGAAGGLIGITNAPPQTLPAVPFAVAGVGAVLTSWIEDIWIATGASDLDIDGAARRPPAWSIELGETWHHDQYRERLLQRAAGTVTIDRYTAGASTLVDTGGDAWLVLADLRARVLGTSCGDCLVIRAGGRIQRDDDDRVTQLVGEIEIGGRLGLGRFDRAMRTGFVELSTGIGIDRVRYSAGATDVDRLLLTRFAWGAYIPGGELTVYYDHRRDGLAGGINASRASGFIGSFGAGVDVRVAGPWAVRGEFQIGNAYLTTLAFAYRGDPR